MKNTDISPRALFGFRLVMLGRHWRQALNERMAVIGFSDATWAPLIHLDQLGDGISQKELAGRIGLDTSSLVRLLDILGERGDIERLPDESDRRAKRICLTEKGKASVKAIRGVLVSAETEMLADVDDGALETVMRAFDTIERHLGR
jgi:MarR family transcriptional regulator, transcriptional regulator for hemolysin